MSNMKLESFIRVQFQLLTSLSESSAISLESREDALKKIEVDLYRGLNEAHGLIRQVRRSKNKVEQLPLGAMYDTRLQGMLFIDVLANENPDQLNLASPVSFEQRLTAYRKLYSNADQRTKLWSVKVTCLGFERALEAWGLSPENGKFEIERSLNVIRDELGLMSDSVAPARQDDVSATQTSERSGPLMSFELKLDFKLAQQGSLEEMYRQFNQFKEEKAADLDGSALLNLDLVTKLSANEEPLPVDWQKFRLEFPTADHLKSLVEECLWTHCTILYRLYKVKKLLDSGGDEAVTHFQNSIEDSAREVACRVKQPISTLDGLVSLFLEIYFSEDDEKQGENFQRLRDAIELDFSLYVLAEHPEDPSISLSAIGSATHEVFCDALREAMKGYKPQYSVCIADLFCGESHSVHIKWQNDNSVTHKAVLPNQFRALAKLFDGKQRQPNCDQLLSSLAELRQLPQKLSTVNAKQLWASCMSSYLMLRIHQLAPEAYEQVVQSILADLKPDMVEHKSWDSVDDFGRLFKVLYYRAINTNCKPANIHKDYMTVIEGIESKVSSLSHQAGTSALR